MFDKGLFAGAVLAGAMAASGGASATVIDFTSASTGHSGSILGGSVTWTMTASGHLNNSQAFDGNTTPAGTGLSFETDGYGVGLNDDEITTGPTSQQWIDVTFSQAVRIDAIHFLDLFRARTGGTFEVGQAMIDGTTVISLAAVDLASSGAPGFVSAVFKPIYATVIRLTVLSGNDGLGFADGALAGIGIAPVPVPAAGLMLLGGLGGVAAVRRRRRS
jgi:hypothetical protein